MAAVEVRLGTKRCTVRPVGASVLESDIVAGLRFTTTQVAHLRLLGLQPDDDEHRPVVLFDGGVVAMKALQATKAVAFRVIFEDRRHRAALKLTSSQRAPLEQEFEAMGAVSGHLTPENIHAFYTKRTQRYLSECRRVFADDADLRDAVVRLVQDACARNIETISEQDAANRGTVSLSDFLGYHAVSGNSRTLLSAPPSFDGSNESASDRTLDTMATIPESECGSKGAETQLPSTRIPSPAGTTTEPPSPLVPSAKGIAAMFPPDPAPAFETMSLHVTNEDVDKSRETLSQDLRLTAKSLSDQRLGKTDDVDSSDDDDDDDENDGDAVDDGQEQQAASTVVVEQAAGLIDGVQHQFVLHKESGPRRKRVHMNLGKRVVVVESGALLTKRRKTIRFKNIVSVEAGAQQHALMFAIKTRRGTTFLFETATARERDTWVSALNEVLVWESKHI
ncbi:PH domain containing protein [Plasmodiophora brassicae]